MNKFTRNFQKLCERDPKFNDRVSQMEKLDPWDVQGEAFQEILSTEVLETELDTESLVTLKSVLKKVSDTLLSNPEEKVDESCLEDLDKILYDFSLEHPTDDTSKYYSIVGFMVICAMRNMIVEKRSDTEELAPVIGWLGFLMKAIGNTIAFRKEVAVNE